MQLIKLEKALEQLSGDAYPVDTWQPTVSTNMDMVIKADGQWIHQGDPILRDKLVVLFSKILTKQQQTYYLITPAEKVAITVDDAPFLVVDFDIKARGTDEQVVWLITNIGDRVPLSAQYNLNLKGDEQRPYLNLWRNLDALIERNTYYQLIDCATQKAEEGKGDKLMLQSDGVQHCLGVF